MPAPHNRKHNIYNPDEASAGHNSNILHDDEAFEKFDMGATGFHRPGSKNANQAMSNRNSIKQSMLSVSSVLKTTVDVLSRPQNPRNHEGESGEF